MRRPRWLSDAPSPADAAAIHDCNEYPGDWEIVGLADLDTGEVTEAVATRTTTACSTRPQSPAGSRASSPTRTSRSGASASCCSTTRSFRGTRRRRGAGTCMGTAKAPSSTTRRSRAWRVGSWVRICCWCGAAGRSTRTASGWERTRSRSCERAGRGARMTLLRLVTVSFSDLDSALSSPLDALPVVADGSKHPERIEAVAVEVAGRRVSGGSGSRRWRSRPGCCRSLCTSALSSGRSTAVATGPQRRSHYFRGPGFGGGARRAHGGARALRRDAHGGMPRSATRSRPTRRSGRRAQRLAPSEPVRPRSR